MGLGLLCKGKSVEFCKLQIQVFLDHGESCVRFEETQHACLSVFAAANAIFKEDVHIKYNIKDIFSVFLDSSPSCETTLTP